MWPGGFVGRREQLAVLEDAVQRADGGEPQLVVVGGDAGMGKTRLLGQLADRVAETDAWVLRTACVELGTQGLPLAPLTAALRQLAEQVSVEAMSELAPGSEPLWRLLPEMGGRSLAPEKPASLFDLFGMVLQRLGTEHPVLWLVDDLHWADRSTRELLGLLARTLVGCRVAMVAAYRADDLGRGHPLPGFLAELGHLPGVRRVGLPGLSRAEVAELLARTLPYRAGSGLVDRVYRRSGGNPLYALELAVADPGDDGPDELPDSLRHLLLQRVERLPGPAQVVVRWAAVGGRCVPHDLLAATISLPEAGLLAALRAAVDARVLVAGRDGYAFGHDLMREAVAGDLLPAERGRLHRRVAETLSANPGLAPPDRCAAETAYHWYEAGDTAKALPALLRAAEEAESLAAHAEQALMLDRALRLWEAVPVAELPAGPDRLDLFESAIAAATWAGDHHQAVELVDRALHVAGKAAEPADPHQVAMLHAQQALLLHDLRRDGALAAAEQSLRLLPAGASVRRAEVLNLLGPVLVMLGRAEQARRAAEEAARFAAEVHDVDLEISARSTLGWALTETGAYPAAVETLRDTLRLAQGRPGSWQIVRLHLNLSKALHGVGQYQPAIQAALSGVETARAAGMERTLGALAYVQLATSLTAAGRWDQAEATIRDALALDPPSTWAASLHALRAEIALACGDLGAADGELSLAAAAAGNPAKITSWTLPIGRLQAELALAEGRIEDARRAAAGAVRAARGGAPSAEIWAVLTMSARIGNVTRLRAQVLGAAEHGISTAGGLPEAGELRAVAAGLATGTPVF